MIATLDSGSEGEAPGRAAEFAFWAASIGEPVELLELTSDAVGAWGRDGARTPRMIHLPVASLFAKTWGSAALAIETARRGGTLLAVDLAGWSPVGGRAGAEAAYVLSRLAPEILIAEPAGAAILGVPLEGLAKVPVVWRDGEGCDVYGRRVPAPAPAFTGGGAAFAAAFCAAYLEGATPLEAAGRAVIVAGAAGSETEAGAAS